MAASINQEMWNQVTLSTMAVTWVPPGPGSGSDVRDMVVAARSLQSLCVHPSCSSVSPKCLSASLLLINFVFVM